MAEDLFAGVIVTDAVPGCQDRLASGRLAQVR
jgi:hypothetical protein